MGGVVPNPPGEYDVVVVGSGPGGLQTSYFLSRLGVRHAVLSADDGPGGMFRFWPIFQRLLSRSKPAAPYPRGSRAYEKYDRNSLISDEPEHRGLVPAGMDRAFAVPTRAEMEDGLVAFAQSTGLLVNYGCRWSATRRLDDGRLALETAAGEYVCKAAVFALGVTHPWKPDIPGLEGVPHYADTRPRETYDARRVFVIGKRNSGFELADGLLPWAREIMLASPRPVRADVLARASVNARYFQPIEDKSVGGGTTILDAAVERVARDGEGYRVSVHSKSHGELDLECDDVIAATGFTTPFGDLVDLGLSVVARDRIPALTPFFESATVPGVFFAGNASQGAFGLRKDAASPMSTSIEGFRYNARILARYLAERLGRPVDAPVLLERTKVAAFLAEELDDAPELWVQRGYLARVVVFEEKSAFDIGIQPLEHFLDSGGSDAIAVTIERVHGELAPVLYVRRKGAVEEVALEPNSYAAFQRGSYRHQIELLLP